MKKVLVLFAIVLGLTGCSMNVAPTIFEEPSQNSVEWIITEDESRAAGISLDGVYLEIYRVPIRDNKFIKDEADYLEAKLLQRGESFSVPSAKDYNYEFATYVRCIEFNYGFMFGCSRDEINFFDYEGDIVMEVAKYYRVPPEHDEAGWTLDKGIIHYIGEGEDEGWEIKYVFLNKNAEAMSRFYKEHKYGGRIEWDK